MAQGLADLKPGSLGALNPLVDAVVLDKAPTTPEGIFK
ncbi:2-methylcitrate dehydratase [Mycobacteroides abscessus subsp. abscessus]|nr:2-methylcitrate dehydratase [Mycobacteroides abscessus subsp. abscessus]